MSAKLKFEATRLITGINVMDGMLFFTDDKTEPKKINIEVFKNADHSTGTTFVYGRKFQERDITVIRPAPMESLKTGLSTIDPDFDSGDGVTPYAESIDILTNDAIVVSQTEADLFGYAESSQANIDSVGFYYISQETMGDTNDLALRLTEGTKVTASNLNNGSFNHRLTGLTADTRYYFVAFGYNKIGQEIIADNVLTFRTERATVSKVAPTVTTLDPVRTGAGKYSLKGKISDLGGADVTEACFYIIHYDILQGLAQPSTLVGMPGATKVSALYDAASGEYHYNLSAGDLFYVEFYAKNNIGGNAGGVKGGLNVTGTSTLLKPIVNYITQTTVRDSTINIQVTGRVVNQNGRISERGFYLSKKEPNLGNTYYQHNINAGIFKIPVAFDALNVESNYTLDTTSVPGLHIYPGDTLYVMPYANNGIEGRGPVIPIPVTENNTAILKPGVLTVQPSSLLDGNDVILKIGVDVKSNGYNSETSGLTNQNGVSNLGCIVYKGEFNEFGNLTREEKETKILDLLSSGKADKIIFQRRTLLGQVFNEPLVNITATGKHTQNFDGTPIAPLDEGHEYYVLGFAANSEQIGYGAVLSIKMKFQDQLVPTIRTISVENDNNTHAKTFNGSILGFGLGQENIYDAGFAIAATPASSFSLNNSNLYSLRSLNTGTVQNGTSITKINNFINSASNADPSFSIKIPNLYTQFLPAGNSIQVQAWVQLEAGGPRYGATYEGEGNVKTDGILSFVNSSPPVAETAPTVSLSAPRDNNVTATGGPVFGSVTHRSMHWNEALKYDDTSGSATQTGIFYAVANTLPANGKEDWLRANGTAVYPYYSRLAEQSLRNTFSYNFGTTTNDDTVLANTITFDSLDSDTSYSMVAWVGNSAGYNSSEVITFKTKPRTSIFVSAYFQSGGSQISTNKATIAYVISGYGDTTLSSSKLFYIKKSDISANPTAAEISADGDAVFVSNHYAHGPVKQGTRSSLIITDLEPGTEYWAMWEKDFVEYGVKRSEPLGFKTTGGAPTPVDTTIDIDKVLLEYDSDGRFLEGPFIIQREDRPVGSVKVDLTPLSSDFGIIKGNGNWTQMHFSKKIAFGNNYAIFKPTALYPGQPDRNWSCSIFNTLNPTELIKINLRQKAAATHYDNPEDEWGWDWDSFGDSDGVGSDDSNGGGGSGSGGGPLDFGDEGTEDDTLGFEIGDDGPGWNKNPFNNITL